MNQRPNNLAAALRWAGLLGIAVIATARCLIVFMPQVLFIFDPATDTAPIRELGPAGSLWLDVALLGASGLGLLGEALARRKIDWLLLALALIPVPVVIWHGWQDAGNLWRGSTWAAAALAAVVVAHLVRDGVMRAAMIALLAAVVAPLAVRGAAQIWYEHPMDVEQFKETKAQLLRERGWEPDSPEARLFERRLKDAAPFGWFVTTNVFGSILATSLMAWTGLTVAAVAWRRSLARGSESHARGAQRPETGEAKAVEVGGHVGAAALAALASAWGVAATRSKGAILAALAGLVALAWLGLRAWRGQRRVHEDSTGRAVWITPWIAPLAMLAGLGAIAVRGLLVAEEFLGDKSLLYRWHYLVASVRVIAANWLAGVGPDGFQRAYLTARLPRNPEEVASAHNVFVDWLSMLGISGLAWIALVMTLAWRAGVILRGGDEEVMAGPVQRRGFGLPGWLAIAGVVAAGGALLIERAALDPLLLFMRVLGAAGLVALALSALRVIELAGAARLARRAVSWGLLIGAAVLLMHSQIEMTFHQPGAVAWCMCFLSVAGGARAAGEGTLRGAAELKRASGGAVVLAGVVLAGVVLAGAAALALLAAMPATRQQAMAVEAARVLARPGANGADDSRQREMAARLLHEAYTMRRPPEVWLIEEAARQLARAAELATGGRRLELLSAASIMADDAAGAHERSASLSLAIGLSRRLARLTGEREHLDRALGWARRVTEIDPHSPAAWRRLGDVLWDAGRHAEAAAAYHEALRCNENFALDPLKQFSLRDRGAIEKRIAEADGAPAPEPSPGEATR